MTQQTLLEPVAPPRNPLVDLRCCDCQDLVASIESGIAHVVFADPPWSYQQTHGARNADEVYACLDTRTIVNHVVAASRLAPRLVLWLTWPILAGEWPMELDCWGRPVTGGSWHKTNEQNEGQYGMGYHWGGCSEPVLVYSSGGQNDRAKPLRNAENSPAGAHSRKPAEWQAQMVARWCPPGGLVVDLYAGLGSVAEAVLLAGEGRRYVGAEISPERHAAALSLLAQVNP